MKKSFLIPAAILSLGLAACDGPAENAYEDVGEQAAESVNEQAEALEEAEVITDEQEDAVTEAAEERADTMEEIGEEIDHNEVAPVE